MPKSITKNKGFVFLPLIVFILMLSSGLYFAYSYFNNNSKDVLAVTSTPTPSSFNLTDYLLRNLFKIPNQVEFNKSRNAAVLSISEIDMNRPRLTKCAFFNRGAGQGRVISTTINDPSRGDIRSTFRFVDNVEVIGLNGRLPGSYGVIIPNPNSPEILIADSSLRLENDCNLLIFKKNSSFNTNNNTDILKLLAIGGNLVDSPYIDVAVSVQNSLIRYSFKGLKAKENAERFKNGVKVSVLSKNLPANCFNNINAKCDLSTRLLNNSLIKISGSGQQYFVDIPNLSSNRVTEVNWDFDIQREQWICQTKALNGYSLTTSCQIFINTIVRPTAEPVGLLR